MDQLVRQLSSQWTGVAFARVEAEEVDELTERYDVSAVPFFTFHKGAGAPWTSSRAPTARLSRARPSSFGVASSRRARPTAPRPSREPSPRATRAPAISTRGSAAHRATPSCSS